MDIAKDLCLRTFAVPCDSFNTYRKHKYNIVLNAQADTDECALIKDSK